ncbi:helicase-exonuclease AddAB subunit AddA, partial [Lactobacillus sp. XV13L]|nr:helicase-exonuclease AddAB subunit AddA [Lactobacillus sp. XV13L]
QDTNPLQETIIQKIRQPQPGNLFMVGDVKQSIYGFRQAAPQLFVSKYHQMQKNPAVGQLINLTDNFRSSENVIKTVNGIFERIMYHKLGDLDYTKETRLVAGAHFPKDLDTQTEVILNSKTAQEDGSNSNEQAQIRLIIAKIQEMFAHNYQIYDRKT